ncbi:hypothetical protein VST7929_00218 [Vibrio stylophorae]|uniref:BRCT domain-containing protein n=1 Tax=Vibrio stylophorae TaxID=659351 RepID=A0ABN8DMP8_9VIBR|nr:hypothetical protein [Vibrio stylophorae]CAH0532389.1 hypothetical protein VST7929_00218 [Vibrio stylophorae]
MTQATLSKEYLAKINKICGGFNQALEDIHTLNFWPRNLGVLPNFDFLLELPNLSNFCSHAPNLTVEQLAPLTRCSQLQQLRFHYHSDMPLAWLNQCAQLKALHLDTQTAITHLDQLSQCPHIQHLTINTSIALDLRGLADCTQLTQLTIDCRAHIEHLEVLAALPQLKSLKLAAESWPDMAQDFTLPDSVESVTIELSEQQSLPLWLCRSAQLEHLYVKYRAPDDEDDELDELEDEDDEFDDDDLYDDDDSDDDDSDEIITSSARCERLGRLGNLSAFTQLQSLTLQGEYLPALSDLHSFQTFPKTINLYFDANLAEQLTELVMLPKSFELNLSAPIKISGARFNALQKKLRAAQFSRATKQAFIEQICFVSSKALPNALQQPPYFLALLEMNLPLYLTQANQWLSEHSEQTLIQSPLQSGAVIYYSGQGIKAKALNEKAKETGLRVSKTLDDSVTHVVIGNRPQHMEKVETSQHQIINEAALLNFFAQQTPQFLQQAESMDAATDSQSQTQGAASHQQMVAHIETMLRSPDEAAQLLALELIKQGGMVDALNWPLLIALKLSQNAAFRRQAKALLSHFADPDVQSLIESRDYIKTGDWDAQQLNIPASDLAVAPFLQRRRKAKCSDRILSEFARHYWQIYGQGLRFLISSKTSSAELAPVLASCCDQLQGTLDWRQVVGLSSLPQAAQDNREFKYGWTNDCYYQHHLPAPNLLPFTIEQINFSGCRLIQVPAGLEAYTELRSLDLSNNSFGRFPELPKLAQLQCLDLRGNKFGLEVPAWFSQAHPNCKVLMDADQSGKFRFPKVK